MIKEKSEHITPNTDFTKEVICTYKDEQYSVRDNGAVLRFPQDNKKTRPSDNIWTFGKLNESTGYLEISSVRVHRIVATAFYGKPPTKEHVVDHIDTNKQNNRPENLRWVTRLENVLLNPITFKRIELICGSVEAFLANPSKFRDLFPEPNYQWMCSVSKKDAQASLKHLIEWANSDKSFSGGTLGKWIYNRGMALNEQKIDEIFKQVEKKTGISRKALCFHKAKKGAYYEARIYATKLLNSKLNLSGIEIGKLIGLSATTVNLYLEACADMYSGDYAAVREREFKNQFEVTTENYIQKNWGTKSEFPSCPQKVLDNPIGEYADQLKDNTLFFQNSYYSTTVIRSEIIEKGESLLVIYELKRQESTNKRFGIMKIKFENGKFVHEIILNYNGSSEHYWLIDVENHYNSIIEGSEWSPIYDSQGKEFKGDYMPF